MINNDEKLIIHLQSSIDDIFKVLPLYEKKNAGIDKYIQSLLLELFRLDSVVNVKYSHEYFSFLSTLDAVRTELLNYHTFCKVIDEMKSRQTDVDKLASIIRYEEVSHKALHPTIKGNIFKSISIVNSIISKLKDGV